MRLSRINGSPVAKSVLKKRAAKYFDATTTSTHLNLALVSVRRLIRNRRSEPDMLRSMAFSGSLVSGAHSHA
jgi:hypothetical protein